MKGQELEDAVDLPDTAKNSRVVKWTARVLCGVLLVLPFALAFVPWNQNVRGEGRVIALDPLGREQTIEATIDGRIMRWWVAEGSVVKAGDPLCEITDNDPKLLERLDDQIELQQARYEAAEAKVINYADQIASYGTARDAAMRAARDRVSMAEQRITASERSVEAAEITLQTAEINLERQKGLREDGLNSVRDLEVATLSKRKSEAELAGAQAALAAAKADRSAKAAEVEEIAADFSVKVNSAEAHRESSRSDAASAQSSLISLESAKAKQLTQRLESPVDGTVLRLMANPGSEFVKKGEPIMVIVPDFTDSAVEIWVDGNDAPLLSLGRHVRIQFEGWPAVQIAGWPSVAVGTFGGKVRLIDATDDGRGMFRVVVVPDTDGDDDWPDARFLRQGVRARGWILLEEVTLGFEIWRNLNGFPPLNPDAKLGETKSKK